MICSATLPAAQQGKRRTSEQRADPLSRPFGDDFVQADAAESVCSLAAGQRAAGGVAIRNVPATPDLRTFAGAAPESEAWLSFCRDIFVNRDFAPRARQATLRVGGLQGSDSVSTRTLPLNPSRIRSHSKSSFLSVNFPDAAAGKFTLSRPAPAGAYCQKHRRGSHQQGLPIANGGGGDLASQLQSPAAHPGPRPEEA